MGKSADTAQPNSVASGLGVTEKQGIHDDLCASRRVVRGQCNCPSAVFQKPAQTVVLGPDHKGMRIDASGVLCNNNKGSTQLRMVMLGHLRELAQRYYAGDTSAVDAFLQMYCLGPNAREVAKERQGVAAAEGEL